MLVVTVLVDGGDQEALGAKEAICNLLERFGSVRAYKVREVKKPPAEQTEQLTLGALAAMPSSNHASALAFASRCPVRPGRLL